MINCSSLGNVITRVSVEKFTVSMSIVCIHYSKNVESPEWLIAVVLTRESENVDRNDKPTFPENIMMKAIRRKVYFILLLIV